MELGWIDFSKTERSKILSVLDLLGEKGVLDELGISQIRDGYSDLFFPGTSTNLYCGSGDGKVGLAVGIRRQSSQVFRITPEAF